MKPIICIYQIINTVNKKIYIGQSWDYRKRKYEHFRKLNLGNHINEHLQSAFIKYGADKFVIDIVEQFNDTITVDFLNQKEADYINNRDLCNPKYGYNNMYGGSNHKHTEQAKKKMSELALKRPDSHKYMFKGVTRSDEIKAKITASKMGHPVSPETREKLSIQRKGKKTKPCSEETKRKISEAKKGINTGRWSEERRKAFSDRIRK